MALFSNWDTGKPLMARDDAVRFMKAAMPDLVRRACDEGWQSQLLGFVQRQHRKPDGAQIAAMVKDHDFIDGQLAAMDDAFADQWGRREIAERRVALKEELLKPIELKAAG